MPELVPEARAKGKKMSLVSKPSACSKPSLKLKPAAKKTLAKKQGLKTQADKSAKKLKKDETAALEESTAAPVPPPAEAALDEQGHCLLRRQILSAHFEWQILSIAREHVKPFQAEHQAF